MTIRSLFLATVLALTMVSVGPIGFATHGYAADSVAAGDGVKKKRLPVAADNPLRDPLHLLEELETQRLELEARGRQLDDQEKELNTLVDVLGKRIEALKSLRESIREERAKEKAMDDANIARLAKIYSSMKAKEAAGQFKNMDRRTAVKVLKVMREKVASKILGKMDAVEAASLADELGISLAERRRRGR
ncbi:MAG: hypothetical protein HQL54_06010 [Magnetococcales bacterium]|nr:hypothetical protein [Magnetococcales bacterium]